MGELTFFLGLQVKQKEDGIFISQDKYVAEILRKFSFTDVRITSTPMDIEKPLLKDSDGDDVDVHLYRSMIGSLMYLTLSRSDIMFVVYACARFQVTPKVSHSHVVKRIFSDYAGASLDRKSTTGGCQLIKKVKRLEDKLNKSRRKRRLVLSEEEDSDTKFLAQEDPSKPGRKIAQIDEDKGITLDVSTTNVSVNTGGAEISTASPKITSVSVVDVAVEGLVYIRRSAAKRKDKGKAIMEESEPTQTKTKILQELRKVGCEEL
ncbi:hypothetical protein Tco_1334726 [Tanacetum coccineum]